MVPVADGSKSRIRQILDEMKPGLVSVAFIDRRFEDDTAARASLASKPVEQEVFSKLTTFSDSISRGEWPIVGDGPVILPQTQWPNEEFRSNAWVGCKYLSIPLVVRFLNAYSGLEPWDAMYLPDYYDGFLSWPEKKPATLVFKNQ